MDRFYDKLHELIQARRRLVIATVIESHGSTPRHCGAKMIIAEVTGGIETHFSVGGGPFEATVAQDAAEAFETGRPFLREYQLNENSALGFYMTCGGRLTVFFEPVLCEERLIIFGAGHVGQALALKAAGLGFQLTLVDDRPDQLQAAQHTAATRLALIETDENYERGLPDLNGAYIVIVTRCHKVDKEVLRRVIRTAPRYLGLIGSQRKILMIKAELEAEEGLSSDVWRKLHAPIGLPIGGETPEEIAISILAELIQERNRK